MPPPKLRALIRGLPRERCGPEGLRVTIEIEHDAKLRLVTVSVNGRRVRRTRHDHFVVRVPADRLKQGRNRVVVAASDATGQRTRHVAAFKSC